MTNPTTACPWCSKPLQLTAGGACSACGGQVLPLPGTVGAPNQVAGFPGPGPAIPPAYGPPAQPGSPARPGPPAQPGWPGNPAPPNTWPVAGQQTPGTWGAGPQPPGYWQGQWAPAPRQNHNTTIIVVVVVLFFVMFVLPLLMLLVLSSQITDILSQIGNNLQTGQP